MKDRPIVQENFLILTDERKWFEFHINILLILKLIFFQVALELFYILILAIPCGARITSHIHIHGHA